MKYSNRLRFVLVTVLLVSLFGVCIWFGTLDPNPNEGRYPFEGDVATDPEAYLDHRVVINGRVTETDPLTLQAKYTVVREGAVVAGASTFTVTDGPTAVETGDHVQVFGVLHEPRLVEAASTVVTPSRQFGSMYLLSFFAGVWTLTRLLRGWRIDPSSLSVAPRESPLSLRSLWTRPKSATEDDGDA